MPYPSGNVYPSATTFPGAGSEGVWAAASRASLSAEGPITRRGTLTASVAPRATIGALRTQTGIIVMSSSSQAIWSALQTRLTTIIANTNALMLLQRQLEDKFFAVGAGHISIGSRVIGPGLVHERVISVLLDDGARFADIRPFSQLARLLEDGRRAARIRRY